MIKKWFVHNVLFLFLSPCLKCTVDVLLVSFCVHHLLIAENEVDWKKVADFAAILPKEAKEKLWKGVLKTQKDETMAENKRIGKVLRTFVMLHLTTQYKREYKEVPDYLREKLPAITKNPARFITKFIKQPHETHNDIFLSIYNELKTKLQCDKKMQPEKWTKKLNTLKTNFDELTKQAIQPQFNQVDFAKSAYLQYILHAYEVCCSGTFLYLFVCYCVMCVAGEPCFNFDFLIFLIENHDKIRLETL